MGFPSENVLAMYKELSPLKLQVRGHNLNKKDIYIYIGIHIYIYIYIYMYVTTTLRAFQENVYTFFK